MQDDHTGGESSRKLSRLPAIAPKDGQTLSTSSIPSRISTTTVPPRARLPPRSRNGCWTCRTRKVKCDEGRPICGQCHRLGHTCDYNPRLSFRDDTYRVVERMAEVTVAGSAIWDRSASPAPSSGGSVMDDLPPFSSLLTDEDRERKAEASKPGTYNVIATPGSFEDLAEYAIVDQAINDKSAALNSIRRMSLTAFSTNSIGRDTQIETVQIPGDANIVILPRFEDLNRRGLRDLRSPVSPTTSCRPGVKREEGAISPFRETPELNALRHFRNAVWKQLIPPEYANTSSIVLIDEAAAQFPPLVRAMMAVGSLAKSQQDSKERVEALQHYHHTVAELHNALQTDDDLASDGAFLTHFLLLIYEIATAENEQTNMWTQHISTLLQITLQRRLISGGEKYPFVVWWISNIDLDALLSGVGDGQYVGYMTTNDLIPPPGYSLYPLGGIDGASMIYDDEKATLTEILQLDYDVTFQAVQLGLLAAEFRRDILFDQANPRHRIMNVKSRQSRIYDIQEFLHHLWHTPDVQRLAQTPLPRRPQRLFHHAWMLYRACIIYSYTSMWPGQRIDAGPGFDSEIQSAVEQILQVAQATIEMNEPHNPSFLNFPLFMAGFASDIGVQKRTALSLIRQLQPQAFGNGNQRTIAALEAIYRQQQQRFQYTGNSLGVDWLQVMMQQGLTVVNFGF